MLSENQINTSDGINNNSLLSAMQFPGALDVYINILRDHPEDIGSCIVLGDLYQACSDTKTAEWFYTRAIRLDPKNLEIQSRLNRIRTGLSPTVEPVPTDLHSISRLLQRLTGQQRTISEGEIDEAASLLSRIVESEDPAGEIANQLDHIDELLPALVELNIRQARADGRPDLALQLEDLKTNMLFQLQHQDSPTDSRLDSLPGKPFNIQKSSQFKGSVSLLVPSENDLSPRMEFIRDAFLAFSCGVQVASTFEGITTQPDIVIACNPHINPAGLKWMANLSAAKVPILVDLDQDFEQLPIRHPDYERIGLGKPANARAYSSALLMADLVTVPNELIATSLRQAGYPVRILPDGWSKKNILWGKSSSRRDTINIGWVSNSGLADDVLPIRRILNRVLREFSDTQMVVVGDPRVYQMFETLPQNRRLYLPAVAAEDFPYLLSQIDILVVPLENSPYKLSQSDRIYVEAGAKNLPWISSPSPAAEGWQTGGLIANTPDEWHTYLRQFILDEGLRASMGKAGYEHALSREASNAGIDWLQMIDEMLNSTPEN